MATDTSLNRPDYRQIIILKLNHYLEICHYNQASSDYVEPHYIINLHGIIDYENK